MAMKHSDEEWRRERPQSRVRVLSSYEEGINAGQKHSKYLLELKLRLREALNVVCKLTKAFASDYEVFLNFKQ